MKRNVAAAGAGIFLLSVSLAGAQTNAVSVVDPGTQYGVWQGWGTSLAWWSKVVGAFPEPARSDYMDKAFDPVKGLGLNVVRYNIGGGENPAHLAPNHQFMSFRANIPGYEPEPGKWDWTADAAQRWVLNAAIQRGADQLEAFSNSPPWWATVSGSVTGGHGGADNLRPDQDSAFGDYLATVVKHFHDTWHVTFRDVEPLNEPTNGWGYSGAFNGQEGCVVEPAHQNKLINAVTASLRDQKVRYTPVSASDETSISSADRTFHYYDDQARSNISKINAHTYGGGDRIQLFDYAASIGKDLWMSEYGDGDASGMQLSNQILTDVRWMHPAAWVYWQVVDGGGWGLLTNGEADETHTDYGINGKYYVMGQYSRYLRPGMTMIAVTDPHTIAAYDSRTHKLVLVTTNDSDSPQQVPFDLSKFASLGPSASLVRTSATEHWKSLPALPLQSKRLVADLPPKSVSTYTVLGARFSGAPGFGDRTYYRIQNEATGLYLSAPSGAKPHAALGLEPAHPDAGQQWLFLGEGNGIYRVVERNSGLRLAFSDAAPHIGTSIRLDNAPLGDSGFVRPVPAGKTMFKLTELISHAAIAPNGSELTLDGDTRASNQLWIITPVKAQ